MLPSRHPEKLAITLFDMIVGQLIAISVNSNSEIISNIINNFGDV